MQKNIFKSKTINFSLLLAVFAALEMNLPLVKEQIGDNYGYILLVVSIVVALLRVVTTKPLSER